MLEELLFHKGTNLDSLIKCLKENTPPTPSFERDEKMRSRTMVNNYTDYTEDRGRMDNRLNDTLYKKLIDSEKNERERKSENSYLFDKDLIRNTPKENFLLHNRTEIINDYEKMQSDWDKAYGQIQELKKNVRQKMKLNTKESLRVRSNLKERMSMTTLKGRKGHESMLGKYKKGHKSSESKRCRNCLTLLTRGLSITNCKCHKLPY